MTTQTPSPTGGKRRIKLVMGEVRLRYLIEDFEGHVGGGSELNEDKEMVRYLRRVAEREGVWI